MYDFRTGFRAAAIGSEGNAVAVAALATRHPTLALAIQGTVGADASSTVPAITVMIFAEAGRLKFCLRPKWGSAVAFGTLPGISGVEEELEHALVHGELEWRSTRGRASTGQGGGSAQIIPGQAVASPPEAKRKKHDRQ